MTRTALDLFNAAGSKLGIKGAGKNLSADDLRVLQDNANLMIDEMGAERQLSWTVRRYVFPLSSSQPSYPIGPTAPAPWTMRRPTEIQSWGIILPGTSPLLEIWKRRVLHADEYDSIAQKGLQATFPQYCYYDFRGDLASPNANIVVYPVPNAGGYQIALYIPETVDLLTSLTQVVFSDTAGSYPPGYWSMLVNNLVVWAADDFGRSVPAASAAIAARIKNKLKSKNVYVPSLTVPFSRRRDRGGRGSYDVYSDNY